MVVVELDTAVFDLDGLTDRVFLILMAACLPFRDPCDTTNSTSSPTLSPADDDDDDDVPDDESLFDSIRSLTWKKILRVSLLLLPRLAVYSIKPDLKLNKCKKILKYRFDIEKSFVSI